MKRIILVNLSVLSLQKLDYLSLDALKKMQFTLSNQKSLKQVGMSGKFIKGKRVLFTQITFKM